MSDENDSSSSTIRSLTKERNTQSNNIDSSESSIASPTPHSTSKTTTTTTSPITSKFYHSSPFIPSSHLKAQEKSPVDSTAIQEGRPDREVQPSTTGLNGIVELRNHLPQLGSIKSSYNSEPQVTSSVLETEVGSGSEKNAMADQDRPRSEFELEHCLSRGGWDDKRFPALLKSTQYGLWMTSSGESLDSGSERKKRE